MGIFIPSLLLLPLLASANALQDEHPIGPNGLPVAVEAMRIPLDEELMLPDLIESYCSATGIRILASDSVQVQVKNVRVSGFGGSINLQPSDVQAFFESTLASHGFRLKHLNTQGVTTLALISEGGSERYPDKAWHVVSEQDLAGWENNAAFLIETTITMDEVDARQLSTSLRPMLSNPIFENIMSAGTSNAIIVRGTGQKIAGLAKMIQNIESKAKAEREKREANSAAHQGAINLQQNTGVGQMTPAPAPPKATPASERPHLLTAVLQVPHERREVMNVLINLSSNRHNAENVNRLWFTADNGTHVFWPKPRLYTVQSSHRTPENLGGPVIVQATAEDIEWIKKAMLLVSGLAEGTK